MFCYLQSDFASRYCGPVQIFWHYSTVKNLFYETFPGNLNFFDIFIVEEKRFSSLKAAPTSVTPVFGTLRLVRVSSMNVLERI